MCNRTLQIYLIRVPFGYLLDVWTVFDGERNKVWPHLAHFAIRFYLYYDHLQHLYKTSPAWERFGRIFAESVLRGSGNAWHLRPAAKKLRVFFYASPSTYRCNASSRTIGPIPKRKIATPISAETPNPINKTLYAAVYP